MTDNSIALRLRQLLAETPHSAGRNRGYPAALRDEVVAWLRAQRAHGVSLAALARELAVRPSLLTRWLRPAHAASPPSAPAPFRAVTLAPAPARTFTVHGPAGLRVDGLELDALVVLWKGLA